MSNFRLRTDLKRVHLGDFALPLGIEPVDDHAPSEGYTISYNTGEGEEPDTYTFHVVVSHEKVKPVLHKVFELLPDEVSPILEVDSHDAYRSVDVYVGREDEYVTREEFLELWEEAEPVLLEEGALGAGANSDEPFLEIFLDQWKGLSIHIPLSMREPVEEMLTDMELTEVPMTWPTLGDEEDYKSYDATIRPVIDVSDESSPSMDDLVLELRKRWNLELNVDPDRNLDEAGKELGMTLWNAGIVVQDSSEESGKVGYMVVWASAKSLSELDRLIGHAMEQYPEWVFAELVNITRVAYDDRPDELDHIPPKVDESVVHLVEIHPVPDMEYEGEIQDFFQDMDFKDEGEEEEEDA